MTTSGLWREIADDFAPEYPDVSPPRADRQRRHANDAQPESV
ncbi:hypothetical protein OS242_15140 [Tumebacillus sp. DT12]|uniref:Uncharacterized protein n=1 Tax=Tumebacillus lacus TaxID=2995335 RepID=A0ABT3X4C2_9BACL|nr:hypothetical protein [Tumebacillus lacus]MCX7571286.1 hypothetical protein [Tumebacillus lacus]